jgi:hypothetical protein
MGDVRRHSHRAMRLCAFLRASLTPKRVRKAWAVVRFAFDCVAKVVLHPGSKILKAAGAAFVQRCEGPHRLTLNSQAASTTRLRLYESTIASRFVFSRKIRDHATFDFCNTIPLTADSRRTFAHVRDVQIGVLESWLPQTQYGECLLRPMDCLLQGDFRPAETHRDPSGDQLQHKLAGVTTIVGMSSASSTPTRRSFVITRISSGGAPSGKRIASVRCGQHDCPMRKAMAQDLGPIMWLGLILLVGVLLIPLFVGK